MKLSLKGRWRMRFTALMFSVAGVVCGSPIVITNPSFEAVVLPQGSTDPSIPGWTKTGSSSTYHPSTTQFPGIPDGFNVAAVDNGASISQVLAATLTANTTYTLQVSVGQRADFSLTGYLISFEAGGNLLNSAAFPLPAPGTFDTIDLSFVALAGNPFLGDALSITLQTTGANQAEFDNVLLSSTTAPSGVPEPGSWGMALVGLLTLAAGTSLRRN